MSKFEFVFNLRRFLIFTFLILLSTFIGPSNVQAATAGKVVNMRCHDTNINGLPGGATGCVTYSPGSWAVRTSDGIDAAWKTISGYSADAQACGADNGVGWDQCNNGATISGAGWSLTPGADGYYHISQVVWPPRTSGVNQNDWICKVQIDIYSGSTLVDFIVWRDAERCGAPPPTCTVGTPGNPTNLSPNGSSGTSTSIAATWSSGAQNCSGSGAGCTNCKTDFTAKVWKSGGGVFQTMGWTQTNSWTITANQGPGTYYWQVEQGNGYNGSCNIDANQCPQGSFTLGQSNAPPNDVETFINSVVLADGATRYGITVQGWDAEGGGDVKNEYAMINYQGSNAGQYRGYVGWTANQSDYAYWGGNFSQQVQCSGAGGWAAKYSDYGPEYLELDSCSSSINPNNYKMLQVYFTVRFNTNFTSPSSGNTVSGWVMDSVGQAYGWKEGATFSISSPPRTYNITAQPVCTNGSTATPDHITRLWYEKNSDPGLYDYLSAPDKLPKTATITISSDSGRISMLGLDDGTDPGNLNTYSSPPSGVTKGNITYSWYKTDVSSGSLSFNFAAPDAWCPLNYTLTTSVSPAGTGSVSISPDLATYPNGTSVSLTANPGTGYNFDSWTGDMTGSTNPQSITLNGNKNVTANFVLKTYALTTNVSPAGSGTVSRSPNQATYNHGTSVTLTANPGVGYDFTSWSGDLTGSTNPKSLTMDSPKTVTANFSLKTYIVMGVANPPAAGTVAPSSNTVNYGGYQDFTVALTNNHYHLLSVTGNPCTVTLVSGLYRAGPITAPCTVTATFVVNDGSVSVTTQPSSVSPAPTFTVRNLSGTVVGSGTGPGPVSISLPSAIGGIQYTVTYNPVPGYLVTTTNPVTVTVNPAPDAAATATATYTPTVTVTIKIFNDANGDGSLQDPPETYASGSLHVNCSSTSGNCLTDNTTNSGIINLTLPINTDYSFTYNTAPPNPTIYNRTSGGDVNGVTFACAGTVSMVCNIANLTMSGATVNFLVTGNPPPWIQAWDGDVHSNCDSASGHCNPPNPAVRITVPSGSYFVRDSLGGSGGGLVSTLNGTGGAACPSVSGPCSQRGWFVSNSAALTWPQVIDRYSDTDTHCSNNVCYLSSARTINDGSSGGINVTNFRGGGSYSGKVVIVSGDLTIDAGKASTSGTAINAILVVKGNVTINGSSTANPLEIQGGILASGSFNIAYSLNNNANPAVVFKYNPTILLNSTPLSQPTYIWREVTAQ